MANFKLKNFNRGEPNLSQLMHYPFTMMLTNHSSFFALFIFLFKFTPIKLIRKRNRKTSEPTRGNSQSLT